MKFYAGEHPASEANCPIIGGHSVSAPELKYGVAVTGKSLIEEIRYNSGARSGDLVILTKALGTGILNTAIKRGEISQDNYIRLTKSMVQLNDHAGALLKEYDVGGVTDVTGFSLMGHGMELAKASRVKLKIYASQLPILAGAIEAVEQGHITRGDKSNRTYTEGFTTIGRVNTMIQHICYDPQTSGGLLITVKPSDAQKLLSDLQNFYPQASLIGECRPLENDQKSNGILEQMIFSMNDMRKDGVILSNARSENEILQEADHLYSKKNGLTFEEVAPKGPPENMVSIDEYFSHPQTYDFVLDVRSSAEFAESHIPNAINFEILDNYQRREVGILYKNRGKQIATQKALDFANPKLKELKKITQSKKSILIYCWRGWRSVSLCF